MTWSIVIRAALLTTLALAIAGPATAQSSAQTKVEGIINDYSDTANTTSGPWHIVGEWSAVLKGNSGKADFAASLTMVRTPNAGSPHTHHIALLDGTVTPVGTGYTITGSAAITTNGAPAGFTLSPIIVQISGDPATVPASNFTITFGGGAAGHFDANPVNGVVTVGLP